jgi:hypothetical protein
MRFDSLHDLFAASAGVAGALIGLLFVAISVEHERLTAQDADQVHLVRARSALSAFTNALTVSLFALVSVNSLAICAVSAGSLGILFVAGSVLSVRRVNRARPTSARGVRELTFLIALLVFGFQIENGVHLLIHSHDVDAADTIASLVIVCFLVGIYRSWELIGGPDIGFGHELRELVHERVIHHDTPDDPDATASPR